MCFPELTDRIGTMNNTYKFSTPDHHYTIAPDLTVPKLVSVTATREALEEMLESIYLAGVAEGEDFSHLTIEENWGEPDEADCYVELTTATLALWWDFEAMNYIGVAAP